MSAPVFITHSSRDYKKSRAIVDALESHGIKCWISERDISAGDNYGDAIVDAIEGAQVMLLVFSANANNSDEIKKEIALASQRKITVVPIRIEEVTPSKAFRYELITRNWIDFFPSWDEGLERLVDRISALTKIAVADPKPLNVPQPKPSPKGVPAWAIGAAVAAVLAIGGGAYFALRPHGGGTVIAGDVVAPEKSDSGPKGDGREVTDMTKPEKSTDVSPSLAGTKTPEVKVADDNVKAVDPAGGNSAGGTAPAIKPTASQPAADKRVASSPPSVPITPPSVPTKPASDTPIAPVTPQPAPSKTVPETSASPTTQQPSPSKAMLASASSSPSAPVIPATIPDSQSKAAAATPIVPASVTEPTSSHSQPSSVAAAPSSTASPPKVATPAHKAVTPTTTPSAQPAAVQLAGLVPVTPIKPSVPAAPVVPPAPAASGPKIGPPPAYDPSTRGGQIFQECDHCPPMVVVPRGAAVLGSPLGEPGRQPNELTPHVVTFDKPFAVGQFTVTFDQWDACVADHGCNNYSPDDDSFGRDNHPVIFVSWDDAQAYVDWLKKKTGRLYRLLSEAEWEYAARGCTNANCPNTPFWFGPIRPELANYDSRYAYDGSPKAERQLQTQPVDQGKPNPFGLYNMLGNVQQWVEDCWNPSVASVPADGSAILTGDCTDRVIRGGSWSDKPGELRAAARSWDSATDRESPNIGIRIARTLSP